VSELIGTRNILECKILLKQSSLQTFPTHTYQKQQTCSQSRMLVKITIPIYCDVNILFGTPIVDCQNYKKNIHIEMQCSIYKCSTPYI